jgi:hypothetical protein
MIRWQTASADAFRSGIGKRLSAGFDLDASAREHGALRRSREVGDGTNLLWLALIYATSGLSLRGKEDASHFAHRWNWRNLLGAPSLFAAVVAAERSEKGSVPNFLKVALQVHPTMQDA